MEKIPDYELYKDMLNELIHVALAFEAETGIEHASTKVIKDVTGKNWNEIKEMLNDTNDNELKINDLIKQQTNTNNIPDVIFIDGIKFNRDNKDDKYEPDRFVYFWDDYMPKEKMALPFREISHEWDNIEPVYKRFDEIKDTHKQILIDYLYRYIGYSGVRSVFYYCYELITGDKHP